MFAARIVQDSLAPCGERLTTIQITNARILHDEFLTHRRFSRNSRSSRAFPVARLIEEVRTSPYIPSHWGANQKGMQARQQVDMGLIPQCRQEWLKARDLALQQAERLNALGLHKQVVNYILYPFTWIHVVVSATHWSNFFAQRCHRDAHPDMQKLADLMYSAYQASTPTPLDPGQWHLPYVLNEELLHSEINVLKGMSVARCARVSIKTFDGKIDVPSDLRLYEDLKRGAGDGIGHWSPFEHVGQALAERSWSGNFRGFLQHRKEFDNEEIFRAPHPRD